MIDNKPLELEALQYVQSLVARYGFNYADPNYDQKGGDFFIIEEESGNLCRLLRCQSKGRDVSNNESHVDIPIGYVVDDFLVFVYVKPGRLDETKTYLYTADDIKSLWNNNGRYYSLKLSKGFTNNNDNDKFLFDEDRSKIIGELLNSSSRKTNLKIIKALSESDFYFLVWQKTGILPSVEFLQNEFPDDDSDLFIFNLEKFVYLLCAAVIQSDKNEVSIPIDWAFFSLKNYFCDNIKIKGFKQGVKYYPYYAMIYHRTWVIEILDEEGRVGGYQLHLGDKEEAVEAYVMKDGDYGVAYMYY